MTRVLRQMLVSVALCVALPVFGAPAEIDVISLLKRSDQARGGGLAGLVWEVNAASSAGESVQDMRLRIKAVETATLAETLEPLKSKGTKMLQVDRNMWLSKPGLSKPIPISPRQRLSGLAAIGDIAATNYARDYAPVLLREEVLRGEPCYVLELTAIDRQATYEKLHYWIAAASGLGRRAEFLSLSGKRLKSADFEYDNTITVQGRKLPFISRMVISDELSEARTTLRYGSVAIQPVQSSTFDVNRLE